MEPKFRMILIQKHQLELENLGGSPTMKIPPFLPLLSFN